MNSVLDQFSKLLLGTAESPTLLSKVVTFSLYGLCTYCAILRGVLAGVGLGVMTHFTFTTVFLGLTMVAVAVALTKIEQSGK